MSDAHLRELERRFRTSGSVEDEAAWLRARVQAGELSQERLELAAYCGHQAAREALGRNRTAKTTRAERRRGFDLEQWLSGLREFPKETSVRVAVALTRSFASRGDPSPDVSLTVGEALRVAESWACGERESSDIRGVEIPRKYREEGCFLAAFPSTRPR